jgi:hypothetical protein
MPATASALFSSGRLSHMRAYALAASGCYSVLHPLCRCVALLMRSSPYVDGSYICLRLSTYRAHV